MSPVSGFESVANDFLDRARNLGARILSTSQAAELLT
jgi:hypothetical protein